MKLKNMNLNKDWDAWCDRGGKHGVVNKRRAAMDCRDKAGKIRGYYSDLVLNPKKEQTHSLYPSIDHVNPRDNSDIKVEARVFNDMKSHLTEKEFWLVIDHLYSVGRAKNKIKNSMPRRLSPSWRPRKNY